MSTMDPRPDDLDELLGAYALDAVSDEERRQVEVYLQANARARAEVDDYREIAMLLASGDDPPPDGVWDLIAGALDERPPEPGPELARVLPAQSRGRERRRWWLAGLAAAAALVVIAALSVALVRKDNGTSTTAGGLPQAFAAAKADPANQTVVLAAPNGTPQATAVLEPSGSAFLDASTLPALPSDRTYQLWGVLDDGRAVSFAVLGSRPNVAMFGVDGGVKALAITDERAGGVVAPAQAPTIVGAVH
jgi:anti-sigma-K factor RskA